MTHVMKQSQLKKTAKIYLLIGFDSVGKCCIQALD